MDVLIGLLVIGVIAYIGFRATRRGTTDSAPRGGSRGGIDDRRSGDGARRGRRD